MDAISDVFKWMEFTTRKQNLEVKIPIWINHVAIDNLNHSDSAKQSALSKKMESFLGLTLMAFLSIVSSGDAIIGGYPVSIHRAPFTAFIQISNSKTPTKIILSHTGIIVHERFVLTNMKACS